MSARDWSWIREDLARWGQRHPYAGGHGLYKITSCAWARQQACEQHSSMLPASRFSPKFLFWFPSMMDNDPEVKGKINPSLTKLLLVKNVLTQQEKAIGYLHCYLITSPYLFSLYSQSQIHCLIHMCLITLAYQDWIVSITQRPKSQKTSCSLRCVALTLYTQQDLFNDKSSQPTSLPFPTLILWPRVIKFYPAGAWHPVLLMACSIELLHRTSQEVILNNKRLFCYILFKSKANQYLK